MNRSRRIPPSHPSHPRRHRENGVPCVSLEGEVAVALRVKPGATEAIVCHVYRIAGQALAAVHLSMERQLGKDPPIMKRHPSHSFVPGKTQRYAQPAAGSSPMCRPGQLKTSKRFVRIFSRCPPFIASQMPCPSFGTWFAAWKNQAILACSARAVRAAPEEARTRQVVFTNRSGPGTGWPSAAP